MVLHLKEVAFRPVEEFDLPVIQNIFNSEAMNVFSEKNVFPSSMDQMRQWFYSLKDRKNQFSFVIENLSKLTIGYGCISDFDHNSRSVRISDIMVLPEFQGNGYAQMSLHLVLEIIFLELNMELAYLRCLKQHEYVNHICEKMRFLLEGSLRGRVYKRGCYLDLNYWSINKAEYAAGLESGILYNSKSLS